MIYTPFFFDLIGLSLYARTPIGLFELVLGPSPVCPLATNVDSQLLQASSTWAFEKGKIFTLLR